MATSSIVYEALYRTSTIFLYMVAFSVYAPQIIELHLIDSAIAQILFLTFGILWPVTYAIKSVDVIKNDD